MTTAGPQPLRCPRGVVPEDAAAWAIDGEPHPDVDLDAHVPVCPVCMGVVAALGPSRVLAETLRGDTAPAPEAVTRRAVGRIRLESDALLLARTVLGAAARVARAVPDYLLRGPRRPPS